MLGRKVGRARGHRLRPAVEGLEGRAVLSAAAPVAAEAPPVEATPVPEPQPAPLPIEGGAVAIMPLRLQAVRAEAGRAFDGVVATFVSNTDIPADRMAAAIDWGDGVRTAGVITPGAWGGYDVRGEHIYAQARRGPTTVFVDVTERATGRWLSTAEQQVRVVRAGPMRAALRDVGVDVAAVQSAPADRPAPARQRIVVRRQHFRDAADRLAAGQASQDDLHFLYQVKTLHDKASRSFWQKLGDDLGGGVF